MEEPTLCTITYYRNPNTECKKPKLNSSFWSSLKPYCTCINLISFIETLKPKISCSTDTNNLNLLILGLVWGVPKDKKLILSVVLPLTWPLKLCPKLTIALSTLTCGHWAYCITSCFRVITLSEQKTKMISLKRLRRVNSSTFITRSATEARNSLSLYFKLIYSKDLQFMMCCQSKIGSGFQASLNHKSKSNLCEL